MHIHDECTLAPKIMKDFLLGREFQHAKRGPLEVGE
jgi:hypothetical protein